MSTKQSDTRKKYGVSKAPIPATKAFVKDMEHFQTQGIDGKSWILLNVKDGTRVSVNTYSGNAGKGFKAKPMPIPEADALTKLTKGYAEVPVDGCPVAIQA